MTKRKRDIQNNENAKDSDYFVEALGPANIPQKQEETKFLEADKFIKEWQSQYRLFKAVRRNDADEVGVVLEENFGSSDDFSLSDKFDINSFTGDFLPILHDAILYSNLKIIKKLLNAGADPNLTTYKSPKYDSLDLALHLKRVDIIELLISFGANLNLKRANGETRLFQAVKKNDIESVKLLLDLGIDLNHRDHLGNNAIYYAARNQSYGMVELLFSRGVKLLNRNLEQEYMQRFFFVNKMRKSKMELGGLLYDKEGHQEFLDACKSNSELYVMNFLKKLNSDEFPKTYIDRVLEEGFEAAKINGSLRVLGLLDRLIKSETPLEALEHIFQKLNQEIDITHGGGGFVDSLEKSRKSPNEGRTF